MHAQFLQLARNRKARRLRLEDESGDAATSGLGARFGVEDYHIGNGAIGNEYFGAVDDVAAIYGTRRSADTHSVGASNGLCEAQCADHLGTSKAGQVFPLLFPGTVAHDVVSTQIKMSAVRHGDGAVCAANAASHQCRHHEVTAAAAILFWNSDARVALLSEAFPEPGGKVVAALDLGVMWSNLFLSKIKGALVGELVFFREFKIHELPSFLAS